MKKIIIALGIAVFTLNMFGFGAFAYEQLPLGASENYDEILTDNIINGAITGTNSQDGLRDILSSNLISLVNFVIGSVAILYLVITGIKMIFSQGSADQESRYRQEFIWIVVGLVVVSVAEFIAFEVFDPVQDKENLITGTEAVNNLNALVQEIKRYFEYIVLAFVLVQGGITGYNMIIGGDDEEAVLTNEKKFIQTAGFGIALILFAELLVALFSFGGGSGTAAGTTEVIIDQVIGIVNFLLTIFGIMAVLVLVWAAVYYITSFGNEDQMNRAKRMIITAVVALLVIVSSYSLLTFFFSSAPSTAFVESTFHLI